jgi:hypothetical protein
MSAFTGLYGFAGVRLAAPVVVDIPQVEGIGAVGEELTCTLGNWTGDPTSYGHAWMRDGAETIGTSDNYTIKTADAGTEITCVVTATNAAGSTEAPPSNAISVEAARSSSSKGKK